MAGARAMGAARYAADGAGRSHRASFPASRDRPTSLSGLAVKDPGSVARGPSRPCPRPARPPPFGPSRRDLPSTTATWCKAAVSREVPVAVPVPARCGYRCWVTQAQSEPRQSGPRKRGRRAPLAEGAAAADFGLLASRYRLEERVGRGGMADVWRAHDTRLDRTVAAKLLHPHLLPDETSRARFVAEARAAARLAHPGIVPVHDVVEDGDRTAIIFQFVPGESLADRLAREGPLPPDAAAHVAGEIAEALDHAHRAGVIHRDVKPANVVLDQDGRARLVDFGIARVLNEAAARLTGDGDAIGTLRYMAPEQLTGAEVDERTDLFGLGLVLAEMLTGRPAFTATSPLGLLEAERGGPPSLPGVPADLRAIADGLLAFDPAARPATAGAAAEALRAVASEVPVASGVANPTAAAGARMSGQAEDTAVIPIVDLAGPDAVAASGAATADADHPDAIATLMAVGASVGSSLKALGRSFGPSLAEDADDLEPAGAASNLEPSPTGRPRTLRALALPAALGIALLVAIGVLALGAGAPFGRPAEPGASTEAAGAIVAPSPDVTPSASPVAQPADAGGKGRGKGKKP